MPTKKGRVPADVAFGVRICLGFDLRRRFGGDRSGTLEERIDAMVTRRAAAFESVTNITQGTRAQLWRYQTLRDNYARNQRGLRKDLDNLLPELHSLPDETRESIDAITSFEMWDRLRSHQGLSQQSSISLLRTLLKTVIPAE